MAALLPEPPPVEFRYVLPDGLVAGAAVEIGHVAVTIGLLLAGELDVLFGARLRKTVWLGPGRWLPWGLWPRG